MARCLLLPLTMTMNIGWMSFSIAAMALAGCASTTWNGYPEGTVKYSQVRYEYTAQPILKDPGGKTYQVSAEAGLGNVGTVSELESRGVKRSDGGADVAFTIKGGATTHEPGSFGLGGSYKPALISRMPLTITVKDKSGKTIMERKSQHEEILGMGNATFKTREEAKAAMASISEMMRSSADAKVKQGAGSTVRKTLNAIAKGLFEPRDIAVALPAIRSAGDVDMEAAYTLLSSAESAPQVEQALGAYSALGVDHSKQDGSQDVVGSYGVLCGVASAKVLNGDLSGAWQDTKRAWQMFPNGKEARMIAKVLKEQQEQAGEEIIPEADFDEMMNADQKMMQNQLQNLFGKKKN